MHELSLVFPFYLNRGILKRHLRIFMEEWSADLRRRVEVVIVDDGSPEPAAPVLRELWASGGDRYLTRLPRIRVFRVTEDIPWHQHGARNLGAHVAKARWLLMTDADHVCPPSTLEEVLRLLPTMRSREVLTFGRVDAPVGDWRASEWRGMALTRRDDGSIKPHVNSFCVARKRYWALGAYDESFRGYGTDSQFRRRLFGPGSITHHLDYAPLIRVDRAVIPDASTTTLSRDDRCNVREVLARKAAEGRADKTLTLDFEWEQVI